MTRLVLLVLLAAGCGTNPYDLNHQVTSDGGGTGDGGGDDGGGRDDAGPICNAIGIDDQCNEIDDDCDGVVDQVFDKQIDPNNCGVCNHRCVGSGAVQKCVAGACAFDACQVGFADLDADPLTCEYRCPLVPTIAEDCNGVDDDCDGIIDEDLPSPPAGLCRITPGTPCAGTTMVCATRGTETRWWCDYAAEVEFDPTVPNGIVLQEQLCDGKDGDCDGVVDDAFADLGQQCDNGGIGVCRDVGQRVCDPAMPSQTKCDLSVLPDAAPPSVELCDGLDNDCDGTVDNAAGANRVKDAMVKVVSGMMTYWIDAYEASRPDSTSVVGGISGTRSCSKAGVLPWTGATYAVAQAACASAGKVLCNGVQWQTACKGAMSTTYPYDSNTFGAQTCNTESYDGIAGGADDDVLLTSGARPSCKGALGVFDLSGNLKEWTGDITGQTAGGIDIAVQRGGSYDSPAAAATCDFRLTRAAVTVIEQETGFRCCKLTAP